jgi:hypothetical protein
VQVVEDNDNAVDELLARQLNAFTMVPSSHDFWVGQRHRERACRGFCMTRVQVETAKKRTRKTSQSRAAANQMSQQCVAKKLPYIFACTGTRDSNCRIVQAVITAGKRVGFFGPLLAQNQGWAGASPSASAPLPFPFPLLFALGFGFAFASTSARGAALLLPPLASFFFVSW